MFRKSSTLLLLALLVLNAYPSNGNTSPVVKVIYFKSVDVSRPTDAELDFYQDVMLDAQNYFRKQMGFLGFEPKTFLVDLTPEGKVNIPIARGRRNLRDYTSIDRIEADLPNEYRLMIGDPNNILVIFLGGVFEFEGRAGIVFQSCRANNQCIHRAIIPNKNTNTILSITAHELGHAFGLGHNSREHSLMYPSVTDWGGGYQTPGGLLLQEAKILNRNPALIVLDNLEDTDIDENSVTLTFSYDTSDSLAPMNGLQDWDGWGEAGVWEKTPMGSYPPKPHQYLNFPNMRTWDHWMYSHASSRIVYDISDKNYTRFDAYFDLPNTGCGGGASVQMTGLADDVEIYDSGVLSIKHRNTRIAFNIPENTKTLTIEVSDLGNKNCDHFVFGEPRLFYETQPEPMVREEQPPISDFSLLKNTDVDENGFVNVADLDIVISNLGKIIEEDADPNPDVNRDGVVTQADVDLIIKQLNVGAAPTTPNIPDYTQLLHNYPNPFNPETWIPYQLAEPANVTLHIYAASGVLARTLEVGHQPAGIYRHRSRAAYWDGKNQVGEPVASGVYFYTLSTGDFTDTRKMIIRK